MATRNDIDADITLEIVGESVAPDKFLKGVQAFFGLLQEVTASVCEDSEIFDWYVQVKAGSNLVGVYPQAGFSDQSVREVSAKVMEGIKAFENGSGELAHFSDRVVRHLRELGSIVGTDDEDDTSVRIWVKHDPVDVTHKTVANIAMLLKDGYQNHGSIEGRLQTISERGGFKFVLYEPVWDRPVKCYVNDNLLKDVLRSFGKRVAASGIIKYRKDGSPISIRVEEIEPFPESDDIPDFRSVRGILRKIQ